MFFRLGKFSNDPCIGRELQSDQQDRFPMLTKKFETKMDSIRSMNNKIDVTNEQLNFLCPFHHQNFQYDCSMIFSIETLRANSAVEVGRKSVD